MNSTPAHHLAAIGRKIQLITVLAVGGLITAGLALIALAVVFGAGRTPVAAAPNPVPGPPAVHGAPPVPGPSHTTTPAPASSHTPPPTSEPTHPTPPAAGPIPTTPPAPAPTHTPPPTPRPTSTTPPAPAPTHTPPPVHGPHRTMRPFTPPRHTTPPVHGPSRTMPPRTSRSEARPAPPTGRGSEPTAGRPLRHTVATGETLAAIAVRYRVGYRRIAAANRVADPRRIRPGQVLRIPPPTADTVVIGPGDTLTAIAHRSGTTFRALRALNPQVTDPDRILAGAELRIR